MVRSILSRVSLLSPATWFVVAVVLQVGAFMTNLALDPSGFDRCEALPDQSTFTKQRIVGLIATSGVIPGLVLAFRDGFVWRRRLRSTSAAWMVALLGIGVLGVVHYTGGFYDGSADFECPIYVDDTT